MFFFIFPFIKLLPITIDVAPFLKASLGDITLFWSFDFSPLNLIPGVTISIFFDIFLMNLISWAEQTIPSNLAVLARITCFLTKSFIIFVWPTFFIVELEKLVSTVTPIKKPTKTVTGTTKQGTGGGGGDGTFGVGSDGQKSFDSGQGFGINATTGGPVSNKTGKGRTDYSLGGLARMLGE